MISTRLLTPLAGAFLLALATTAAAAPAPGADNAASVNAGLQAMRDYNLIALKDLTSSSEVQGRAFVGGNLSGNSSNYFTNPKGQTGVALTVAGDVTGGSKNINNGGSLVVGGDVTGGANVSGQVTIGGDAKKINAGSSAIYAGGDVDSSNAKDIYAGGAISKSSNGVRHAGDHSTAGLQAELDGQADDFTSALTDASAYLFGLSPTNGVAYSANGQAAIFDAGVGSGIAVFAISDLNAALKKQSQLQFAMPAGYDTVVINVAGTHVTLPNNINFNGPFGLGSKVIWNFYEAENINLLNKSWYGSVLAPRAELKFGGAIEGSVIARSLVQTGAVRMNNYSGGMFVDQLRNAVPEPQTWIMMILGFGLTGAMLRRRQAVLARI